MAALSVSDKATTDDGKRPAAPAARPALCGPTGSLPGRAAQLSPACRRLRHDSSLACRRLDADWFMICRPNYDYDATATVGRPADRHKAWWNMCARRRANSNAPTLAWFRPNYRTTRARSYKFFVASNAQNNTARYCHVIKHLFTLSYVVPTKSG